MLMEITSWGLFEISRTNVKFNRVYGIDEDATLLTKVLPFGSPLGQSIKYVQVDNRAYLTYLKMNGQSGKGITLSFDLDNIPDNFLEFTPKMATLLDDPPSSDILELELQKIQIEPIRIRDFDIAVFSLLSRFRTIILGDEDEIMKIISAICVSTPNEMKKRLLFVSQSTSLSENVKIIGMPFSDEVLSELDEYKGNYTIIILGDRVYGQFTSKLCKKVADHARKGEYDTIKELLNDFYELARDSNELPPALEFANKSNLHLSDAQLALIIRAGLFGKKLPNRFLEV